MGLTKKQTVTTWSGTLLVMALVSGCAWTTGAKRYTEADLKEKLTEVAEYSYETGCLNMALQLCSRVKDASTRRRCFEYGNRTCSNMSARYSRWIGERKK